MSRAAKNFLRSWFIRRGEGTDGQERDCDPLDGVQAASLACTGGGLFSPLATATTASTFTVTPSPTATPTQTALPFPSRAASPTLIPGIEEPLPAGDAELLITKALRRVAFRCGAASEPVKNPKEEFFLTLLVAVKGGPKTTSAQLDRWIRENGIDEWAIQFSSPGAAGASFGPPRLCATRDRETLALTELGMAFPVAVEAETFILIPEGLEIQFNPIMP